MKILIRYFFALFLLVKIIDGSTPVTSADSSIINFSKSILADLSNIAELRSIAISKDGKLIMEEYFNGETQNPDEKMHIMSVTKSITSLLVGIAIDRGFIRDVNQPIKELIDLNKFGFHSDFNQLTIRQLLTMKAGFDWRSNDPREYENWVSSPDQIAYIANKTFFSKPGTRFNYSDGAVHLLSVIISENTGMSLRDFADAYLFNPIDIGPRNWYTDNRGYNMGGICLILTVKDMIKIGELVLNDGVYEGKQIIPSTWIAESTIRQTKTDFSIPYTNDYGYLWWIGKIKKHEYVMAMGHGGQYILVFKDIKMVISTLCDYTKGDNISFSNSDQIFNTIITKISDLYNNS